MTIMLTKNFSTLQSEVAKHVAADQVIQGMYWDDEDQKGCFIGCLAHANDALSLKTKYGIPLMLTRIAENIFEGLPSGKAVKFFKKFPKSVACDNKDLSLVGWKFLQFELENLPHKTEEVQDVIDGISKLARGEKWRKDEARDAAADADDAAVAARDADAARAAYWTARAAADAAWAAAARDAYWTARAADAVDAAVAAVAAAVDNAARGADAARSAYWTARAAVDNVAWDTRAASSAWDAAMQNYRKQQAKTLLRLIKEAPVIKGNN